MPGGDDEQPGISMEFCEKAVRQILEGWVCEPPGKTKTDAPDANRHRGVTFAGTTNRKRACRKNLQALFLYGSLCWARTSDNLINSQMLYQLS